MASALRDRRGHDRQALLRRDLQLRPLNFTSELPRDARFAGLPFFRDGRLHFCERTVHHKISLARGIVEPAGAPEHLKGSPTACTRFAGARPTPIDVRTILFDPSR